MTEHTPGPWEWSETALWGNGGNTVIIRELGWTMPDEADAHLIAAAPELLAALESLCKIRNTLEVLGEWAALDINPKMEATERAKVDAVFDKVRAAFKKATS